MGKTECSGPRVLRKSLPLRRIPLLLGKSSASNSLLFSSSTFP
jgi:hypothetical protein